MVICLSRLVVGRILSTIQAVFTTFNIQSKIII